MIDLLDSEYKRDAIYQRKCITALRDNTQKVLDMFPDAPEDLRALSGEFVLCLNQILEGKFTMEGVDLNKINYGLF